MSIEIEGLDHLVLRVHDPKRMTDFYCNVLGCTREREVESVGLIQLRAGSALIDLVDIAGEIGRAGGAGPGTEGRNLDHFCLRITDFDADALSQHLAKHGVSIGPAGRRYGADGYGPSVYLEDPEGNTVELKGPPEPQ